MSRRSTRLKDVQQPKFIDSVDEEDANVSDADVSMEIDSDSEQKTCSPAKHRGKKRRAAGDPAGKGSGSRRKKKARGDRGILKELVEMPMDILYEIFGHLEPYDLLNIARTTKAFRSVLMSKSSISFWKEAMRNVPGLPPCPDGLNEPQYAELAFGKHCYLCQRNVKTHTSWQMRLRVCTRCLESDSRFSRGGLCWEIDYGLHGLAPGITIDKGKYYESAVVEKWQREYQDSNDEEEHVFYPNLRQELMAMNEQAKVFSDWVKKYEKHKTLAKAAAAENRQLMLVQRLRDLGWGEELDMINSETKKPQNLPSVLKACQKDFTERVLENLEKELVAAMEKIKNERLTRERKEFLGQRILNFRPIYTDYLLTLPADVFYPNTAEIYFDSDIKPIVDNSESATFTEDEVALLISAFPLALARWRQPIEKKAVKLIRDCMRSKLGPSPKALLCGELNDENAASVLPLAFTTFDCRWCPNVLSTEHAIIHRCARNGRKLELAEDELFDPEVTAVCITIKEAPWNALSALVFNKELSARIESTLVSCGFPPRITAAELDQLDPIFECLKCNNLSQGRMVMKWYTVAQHIHDCGKAIICLVPDAGDVIKVRERMKEEAEKDAMNSSWSLKTSIMCTHCRVDGDNIHTDHLSKCHGITDPKPGVDFILSPSIRPCLKSSRLWPGRCKSDAEAAIAEWEAGKATSAAPPSNESA